MTPGPYIVTTKRPLPPVGSDRWMTQPPVAVATLEEVHSALKDARVAACVAVNIAASESDETLTESGGTVGPLPDGTVVEVEAVSWFALVAPGTTARYDDVQYGWAERAGRGVRIEQDLLLDAFTAQEAKR